MSGFNDWRSATIYDLRKQAKSAACRLLLLWLPLATGASGFLLLYIKTEVSLFHYTASLNPPPIHSSRNSLFYFGAPAIFVWRAAVAWGDRKECIDELGRLGVDVRWNRSIIAAFIGGVFIIAGTIVTAWTNGKIHLAR